MDDVFREIQACSNDVSSTVCRIQVLHDVSYGGCK